MFHTEQKCEIQMVTIASIILRISLEDTPATAHHEAINNEILNGGQKNS